MAPDDRMVVRYLNQLVEDQGRGRPPRVTPDRFADLFRRRVRAGIRCPLCWRGSWA